ncbi:MAG TPA: hypothetical protein VHF87_09435 [Methylomirabilota bacterium]|jgi:ElaB/YqjD/DUF883 family membrane-anchored ribosome-binding protein|nr:hypothetical protein [Methylomirabilota bacterium]
MEERVRREYPGTESSSGEWARSEARDLADAGRQGLGEVKAGVKNYAAEAKEYVQGAVEHTKEYVEDTVHQARDRMAEYREGGMDKVKRDVTGYTREQPMTALLIAVGAGMVLGWLSAAGRR